MGEARPECEVYKECTSATPGIYLPEQGAGVGIGKLPYSIKFSRSEILEVFVNLV